MAFFLRKFFLFLGYLFFAFSTVSFARPCSEPFDEKVGQLRAKGAMAIAEIETVLADEGVSAWISRPFDLGNFNGNNPTDCTDHEIWFYRVLGKHPDFDTCRSSILADSGEEKKSFYEVAIEPMGYFEHVFAMLRKKVCVTYHSNLPHIRGLLSALELCSSYGQSSPAAFLKGSDTSRFLLSPCDDDGHSTVLVSILCPQREKTLATVYLDSQGGGNDNNFQTRNADWKRKTTLCKAKDSSCLDRETPQMKTTKHPCLTGYFFVECKQGLVNGSHGLQTQEEDLNCSFYAMNFCEAVATMVQDLGISEEIFRFAQVYYDTGLDQDGRLAHFFTHTLRQYLPQYYETDGRKKSDGDIKRFHLQQRWDLSAKSLYASVSEPSDSAVPADVQPG